MAGIQGVIFDFNGTMIFDSPIHRAVWHDFIPEHTGQTITDEQVDRTMLGRDNAHILRQYFGNISDAEVERLAYEKEAEYRRRCLQDPVHFRLVDGLVPFLDYLKQIKMPMTIATGSEILNVKFFFEQFDLGKWFDFEKVVYDDGTFPGKPFPDIYRLATSRLGLDPAVCLVFEDSFSGIRAAHDAGIGHIVALSQLSPAPDYKCSGGVDAAVNDFTDAIGFLTL
ncbi:MAG: HAD family hydrolase [Eubacteriales bacterium]|nr:HAD family hydrolase [Eubacteriales bacterium]